MSRNRFVLLALGVLALAALYLSMESGMKVCLFSAVRGVVTLNGSPVPNAEVRRSLNWTWKKKTLADSARTDADGRFTFDSVWDSSLLLSFLPAEPVITQQITIHADGKEYRAWSAGKRNYDDQGEVGRPLVLSCELTSPDVPHVPTHNGIAVLSP